MQIWIILTFIFLSISSNAIATPYQELNTRGLADLFLPRQPIDTKKLGLNAFVNEPQFGSVRAQLSEVKNKLGVRYIRVLFAWNDDVQTSEYSKINYSFYDEIAKSIPNGVSALVILTGLPSWAKDSKNPRQLFIENWIKPTVLRYKNNPRISAFQIWNEPNDISNHDNSILGFSDPKNYLSLLTEANQFIRNLPQKKLIVNAATTAITQNYPQTLNYNKALIDNGITNLVDKYAIHFYGENYHYLILPNGVQEILSDINIPIWVTESGKQGINKQRAYVERTWPFLSKYLPKIERYYYYQFTEGTSGKRSYGLRSANGISDLYRIISKNLRKNKLKN